MTQGLKLTTRAVNERLTPRGIKLLGEWQGYFFLNAFQCNRGHNWDSLGSNTVTNKAGCPMCAMEKQSIERRLSPQEVKRRLTKIGLSMNEPWITQLHRYTFKCAQGHIWKALGGLVLSGRSHCPTCNALKISQQYKLTEGEVQKRLKSRGLFLIGSWKGSHDINTFACIKGHQWKAKGNLVNRKSGCYRCSSPHRFKNEPKATP